MSARFVSPLVQPCEACPTTDWAARRAWWQAEKRRLDTDWDGVVASMQSVSSFLDGCRLQPHRAPTVARDGVPSAATLQFEYEQKIRRRRELYGAAPTTVEAVMWTLRERRLAALKEPETRQRLAQLNEQQLVAIADRLQRVRPHIAPPWSDPEIDQLLAWRAG